MGLCRFLFPLAIELTDDERAQLEAWARRRSSAQALALRSRIVLAAADGPNNTEIAERLGIARQLGAKWRNRFAEHRLDGLTDEPRPGRPRTITDEQVDAVITKTLESTPKDATHWSTRSMAKRGRAHADGGVADLAGVRAPTAPPGHLQAVQGPVVRRQGPRRRRAVSEPARARRRALRRREVPDPGAGSHRADPADAARASPSAPPTTTSAHGTSSLYAALDLTTGKVIGRCTAATARSSSSSSCRPSTARSRPISMSTSCSTTAAPTRRRRSSAGCSRTPASSCTSPRPSRPGSTSSSAGSPSSPPSCSSAARTAPSAHSTPTSAPGSRPGTTTPGPTSGPRPPTRSSTPSRRYCERINDSRH